MEADHNRSDKPLGHYLIIIGVLLIVAAGVFHVFTSGDGREQQESDTSKFETAQRIPAKANEKATVSQKEKNPEPTPAKKRFQESPFPENPGADHAEKKEDAVKKDELLGEARSKLRAVNLSEAADLLSQILESYPDDSQARVLKTELQAERERIEEEKLIQTRIRDLKNTIARFLNERDIAGADEALRELSRLAPDDPDIETRREELSELQSKKRERERRLRSLASDFEEKMNKGLFEEAESVISEILNLNPNDEHARKALSEVSLKKEQFENHMEEARDKMEAEQYEAARESVESAKMISPESAEASELSGMIKEAEEEMRQRERAARAKPPEILRVDHSRARVGDPLTIYTEVQSNEEVEVTLHYRRSGEDRFESLRMRISEGLHIAELDESEVSKRGLEIYVTAQNASGKEARYPSQNEVMEVDVEKRRRRPKIKGF